jgi:very-short-patch-repair endonuclease
MPLRLSKKEAIARGLIDSSKPSAGKAAAKLKKERSQLMPQAILFKACQQRFNTGSSSIVCVDEFENAVPGRKFRIDIAFPNQWLAIEMDGWQYHGKYLADFKRDREKQNLLTLNGWRILRFTASDVNNHLERSLDIIENALLLHVEAQQ